jgi:hypothetical protein
VLLSQIDLTSDPATGSVALVGAVPYIWVGRCPSLLLLDRAADGARYEDEVEEEETDTGEEEDAKEDEEETETDDDDDDDDSSSNADGSVDDLDRRGAQAARRCQRTAATDDGTGDTEYGYYEAAGRRRMYGSTAGRT